MVHLRCAIFNGESDVVEQVIVGRWEVCDERTTHSCFSAVLDVLLPKAASKEAESEAENAYKERSHLCDLSLKVNESRQRGREVAPAKRRRAVDAV